MPRVTIKELQEQLKKSDDIVKWQFEKIQELQEQNENILNNKDSVSKEDYDALSKQFKNLQDAYSELKKLYEHEKDRNSTLINKCTKLEANNTEKHNVRGAGRKSMLSQEQLQKIHQLHKEGLSYGAIAKEVGISKTYVYKLINKQRNKTENKKYSKEDIKMINELREHLREEGHKHSLTVDLKEI